MKIKSQAQAGYLGAVASGRARGNPKLTPRKAKMMLNENRGMKMRSLPERAPARPPSKRAARRVSSRGRR